MKSKYSDPLRHLLAGSSDCIEAVFCGHTHMDEFQILHDANDIPIMYMHVTPSVSPMFGNNPAYQVFFLDPVTGAPVDYVTRMINLANTPDPDTAAWMNEYRFSDAYGQTALTCDTLAAVRKSILDDRTARDRYIRYYAVDNPRYSLINADNWKAFYDCIWDSTSEAFIENYCPAHQSSLMGRKLVSSTDR